MNYFLLCITGIVRQKKAQPYRWCGVAGVCGAVSTGIYMWSCMQGKEIMVLDVLVLPVMVGISYHSSNRLVWVQDVLACAVMAVMTGGCLYAMMSGLAVWQGPVWQGHTGVQEYSLWWILSGLLLLSVVFLLIGREWLQQLSFQKTVGEATVVHRDKRISIRILYDSGNQLVSPYTGERVAVISKALAEQLEISKEQYPLYVPYHSIGGSGVLQAYRIERLEWQDRECMEDVLVAVSEQLGQREIQMILNVT
ncbi:MAG: sigma-E processing peptidase SpoIIGA, partial [Lachnospiraceae bacterium]|nr:sigma-E processing peptidase SpoIIGA [Lachnospiraceae bacterium]